jgi:Fe-S cluster assembly iron-binding protein IscA
MIITDVAEKKIAELIVRSQKAMPDYKLFLRITAMLDDNAKLKHQTYFDYEEREYDSAYEHEGFVVRIDEQSLPFLNTATIDYVESDDNIGFTIDIEEVGVK